MMNPEMMRLAEEQMRRMSPGDLAKMQQQVMSNPNLVNLASETIKNMRTEDFKRAAQQLSQTRPEEILRMTENIANAKPEDFAAMKAQADAQMSYAISGAKMLKQQGNELHVRGQYADAAAKYKLAKDNLKSIPSAAGQTLQLHCALNLMSCYLEAAVADLSKAHEISPDDETIAEVMRDAEEKLAIEGGGANQRMDQPPFASPPSTTDMQDVMRNFMEDPAMWQMLESMMKKMSPDILANMGEPFGIKPSEEDAAKAQQAISSLSLQDLDRMMKWMHRAQRGVEIANKTKNWLIARKGFIIAILLLILAFILHRLGFIGS